MTVGLTKTTSVLSFLKIFTLKDLAFYYKRAESIFSIEYGSMDHITEGFKIKHVLTMIILIPRYIKAIDRE